MSICMIQFNLYPCYFGLAVMSCFDVVARNVFFSVQASEETKSFRNKASGIEIVPGSGLLGSDFFASEYDR